MAQAEARAVERSCGAAGRDCSADHVQPFVQRISPFQGLRLAAAIQELQSGGDGLIGIGREALGVDTFDIADTTASTGKHISDNVFLEVQQGVTSGSAKAKLEIELTPSLSAKPQRPAGPGGCSISTWNTAPIVAAP